MTEIIEILLYGDRITPPPIHHATALVVWVIYIVLTYLQMLYYYQVFNYKIHGKPYNAL